VLLQSPPGDVVDIRKRRLEPIRHELADKGLRLGAPVFVRIFKQSHELEVWVQRGDSFRLYKTFPICKWSGSLGPKLREGDGQSPEGFYRVSTGQLNPDSSYHLSFNLGFPNAYDSAHGRTGSFLMVHGRCVSIGCYAMTDAGIEEIYLIAEAALAGGQDGFDVHVFPFRMTEEAWAANTSSQWVDFWRELQPAYDGFEATRRPPQITTANGVYQIDVQP
jgi:murein L,D-transpeptidase YafK